MADNYGRAALTAVSDLSLIVGDASQDFPIPNKISNSDFSYRNNSTVEIYGSRLRLKITSTANGYLYGWATLRPTIKMIKFKKQAFGQWVVIGGNGESVTAIGLEDGTRGRVIEVTSNTSYTQIKGANLSLYNPLPDDEIRVMLGSGIVSIDIRKEAESDFTNWLTYTSSDITGAISYTQNPCLGFVVLSSNIDGYAGYAAFSEAYYFEFGSVLSEGIAPTLEKLITNPDNMRSRWFGKSWDVLGDSFTARQKYPYLVQEALGFGKIRGYGVSGSCIATNANNSVNAMSIRYTAMGGVADLVTVWGGVNDYGKAWGSNGGIPLGSKSDKTNLTFYGALRVLIEGLYAKYPPTTKIAFIIPTQVNEAKDTNYKGGKQANTLGFYLEDYCQAIRDICGEYGVPYLDLYRQGGISDLNVLQLTEDGLHPNDMGFSYLAPKIANFIEGL